MKQWAGPDEEFSEKSFFKTKVQAVERLIFSHCWGLMCVLDRSGLVEVRSLRLALQGGCIFQEKHADRFLGGCLS